MAYLEKVLESDSVQAYMTNMNMDSDFSKKIANMSADMMVDSAKRNLSMHMKHGDLKATYESIKEQAKKDFKNILNQVSEAYHSCEECQEQGDMKVQEIIENVVKKNM